MNTKTIGLWTFFIGMVLALLTVFVSLGSWVTQVLLVLGILAGLFHQKLKDELLTVGVIYLVLAAVASSLGGLIAVGPYISAIAAAWVGFLGPVALATFVLWGGAFLMVNKEE
jgi:hypothetical protein